MGGGAFAQAAAQGEPTLNTPRMSPEIYHRLKATYTERLRSYFPDAEVASLTEAPEKIDYGDMDFIIALNDHVEFVALANHLGAVGVICHDARKCTLAVPRDGSHSTNAAVVYKHVNGTTPRKAEPSKTVTDEQYAQLDIELVPTELFEWHTFYSSYGDMVALLGHIVHNLGLTVSDRGLWLRLKELDDSKHPPHPVNVADKDGMIHLSHDAGIVMQFLRLSTEKYGSGFQTLEQLYEWLGECRLLEGWCAGRSRRDNSHERQWFAKRTVFARFFTEWLPAHRPGSPSPTVKSDIDAAEEPHQVDGERCALDVTEVAERRENDRRRADLAQEAITFFHKEEEHEAKHAALVQYVHSTIAANLLKPIIAEHSGKTDKKLNEVVRAFRRHIGVSIPQTRRALAKDIISVQLVEPDDGTEDAGVEPQVLELPHTDAESELWKLLVQDSQADADGGPVWRLRDEGRVSKWVKEHWEGVRALERQRLKDIVDAREARKENTSL